MRKWLLIAIAAVVVGAILFGCAQALPPVTTTQAVAKNLTIDEMVAATATALAPAATPIPQPVGQPVNEDLYRQASTWLGMILVYGVVTILVLGVLARLLVPLLEAFGRAGQGIGSCLGALGGWSIWTVVAVTIGGYFYLSKVMGSISPLGLIDNFGDKALIAYALTCGVPALLVALAFFVWVHAKAKRLSQQPAEERRENPPS